MLLTYSDHKENEFSQNHTDSNQSATFIVQVEPINILHISKKIPYPQRDGESVASHALAKSLAEFPNISIDLLSLHTNKHRTDEAEAKGALNCYRHANFIAHNLSIRPLSFIQTVLSGASYNIKRFHSDALISLLRRLLKKERYRFVILETIYTTPYIRIIRELSPATIIVLRLHNIEHLIWKQRAVQETNPIKRSIYDYLSHQLKKYKQNVLSTVDKVISISSTDYQWMVDSELVKSKDLHYLPVGFNTSNSFKSSNTENAVLHLGFIGSMDWDPNSSGLDWFIKQVWEPHFSTLDTIKLHLAGRKYPVGLYSSVSGVVEYGEVDNAAAFLDNFDVLIAPLFIGSGVRIKILESMSRGKAIISTSIGIAGIEVSSGEQAIIADSESQFVKAIKTLMDDRNQLLALQQNAFSFVTENYSQDEMTKRLVNLLNDIKQQI